jgi:hypothetical protein
MKKMGEGGNCQENHLKDFESTVGEKPLKTYSLGAFTEMNSHSCSAGSLSLTKCLQIKFPLNTAVENHDSTAAQTPHFLITISITHIYNL